ncbi:MAG: pyridoxal 5'-phosphate synthase glutaminase subunit PdxT [Myxococcales bacterium]|nr:pyridoxal 5'-phosphate synthase glutaminase subunit PdxT [Myxococcales bacterium]
MIGVLSLQGGVEPHLALLRALQLPARPVREAAELLACSGLVWPGGESTTQRKLIARFALGGVLDAFVHSGRPVLATCAGLIGCAERDYLDVDVERNAYGRQTGSFQTRTDDGHALSFIRAPKLRHLGPEVQVLATVQGDPVAVRERNVVGVCGHPELTGDPWLHALALGTAGAAKLPEAPLAEKKIADHTRVDDPRTTPPFAS